MRALFILVATLISIPAFSYVSVQPQEDGSVLVSSPYQIAETPLQRTLTVRRQAKNAAQEYAIATCIELELPVASKESVKSNCDDGLCKAVAVYRCSKS